MKKLGFTLVIVSLLLAVSCKKDPVEVSSPDKMGYEYVPLKVGQQKVFQIDSIIFNEYTGGVDSLTHFQRMSIYDSYLAEDRQLIYRLKIEERLSDTMPWVEMRMDKLLINKSYYLRNLNNVPTIELVFPVEKGATWNANLLNTKGEYYYLYKEVNKAFESNGVTYPTTLSVIQRNVENLIEKKYIEDRYAEDVGFIYRTDINLSTDFSGDTISGYVCNWTLLH